MATYQSAKQKTETTKQVKANKPGASSSQKMNPKQMLAAPDTMRPEDVLAAQQQLGNQVVQRALGDKRQSSGLTDAQGNLREDISSSIQQSRGSGASLPKELQVEMKQRLGKDFGNVRIHTDSKADKLSRTINARAFTIGSDIFFKNGVFTPSTQSGRETLIHELTHVVQQSNTSSSTGKLKLGAPNTAMEQEADRKGKQGSHAPISTSATGIQRASEEEEEVQMQPEEDEEAVQMQPEEDEEAVQMQPEDDEEAVQMQPEDDEEAVQMQPEEDEEAVQRQPDAAGVVQRNFFTDLFKKKKKPERPVISVDALKEQRTKMGLSSSSSLKSKLVHNLNMQTANEKSKPKFHRSKPLAGGGVSVSDLNAKRKQMGISEDSSLASWKKHTEKMNALGEDQQEKFKRSVAGGIGKGKKFSQVSQREKLIKTIKNPNSSPEELKAAEDQLRTFHKSGKFKKNPATIALKERKKMLKESARGGDAAAAAAYKKENPGMLSKVEGFATKAQGFYGKHKDAIGSVMGLLGIGGKKEEKGSGGGGDGGGYAVIISQLMQENKMLKEQLAQK